MSNCSRTRVMAEYGVMPVPITIELTTLVTLACTATLTWSSRLLSIIPPLGVARLLPDNAPPADVQPIRWWTGLKRRLSSFAIGSVH
jgi:hypothetical protein